MHKYIIFIGNNESRIIQKETAPTDIIKRMKQQGFRKHHIEVEAENEKEAAENLIILIVVIWIHSKIIREVSLSLLSLLL